MQEEDFKKKLKPEEYKVLRQKGTEAPFSGKYWKPGKKGMFRCKACGNEIFSSDTQFETKLPGLQGWPSFNQAIPGSVKLQPDDSAGTHRTEVVCNRCGSHLGHLFEDKEETATGKHYCINSTCLELEKDDKAAAVLDKVKEVAENVELPDEEDEEEGEALKKSGPSLKNILSMIAVAAVGVGIGTVSGKALCQDTELPDSILNISDGLPRLLAPAPAPVLAPSTGTPRNLAPATTLEPAAAALPGTGSADGTAP